MPAHQIAGFRAYLDGHPTPRPVLEWGIRWLETHIPSPTAPVLCHHDFRTGNYMLNGTELTGILDWEFSGWGDPHEDIGWFCSKGWRFARLDREAEDWRTAFTFVTDHSPGALYRAIEPFGRLRIDLHQLVSRPIPRTPWRYRFDAVLAGHPLDPIVNEALREMGEQTRRLQVFGSYPARKDVEEE